MPLDSDISNPDAQLRAEFFIYNEDGPFKGQPHVRIFIPGDKNNQPVYVATDMYKRRFQREWLHFQSANSEDQIIGTPLATWRKERPEEISDGQFQELLILKFASVEQVAMAADVHIAKVGMGANGLRERARSYLNGKNAQANGAEMESMKAELAALRAMMAAPPAVSVPQVARKYKPRGRPRKNKVPNVEHDDATVGAASR